MPTGWPVCIRTNGLDLNCFNATSRLGKRRTAKFLYPELGLIKADAPQPEKRKQLAAILTSKENGRLTRTIVNRLWQKFLGRGLVEPVDDMEQKAWNSDLLDWLAQDLAHHGYDLKQTMKTILTSKAYQMPAVSMDEQTRPDFVFAGPAVRRMNAEQFRDALGRLTEVWFETPAFKPIIAGTSKAVETKSDHPTGPMDLERGRSGEERARRMDLFPENLHPARGARGGGGRDRLRQQFHPLREWNEGDFGKRFHAAEPRSAIRKIFAER